MDKAEEKEVVKRARRSNNVKKADLTDEEIELISKADTIKDISPLPEDSKNAGKNVPWPTWCSIKGLESEDWPTEIGSIVTGFKS